MSDDELELLCNFSNLLIYSYKIILSPLGCFSSNLVKNIFMTVFLFPMILSMFFIGFLLQ